MSKHRAVPSAHAKYTRCNQRFPARICENLRPPICRHWKTQQQTKIGGIAEEAASSSGLCHVARAFKTRSTTANQSWSHWSRGPPSTHNMAKGKRKQPPAAHSNYNSDFATLIFIMSAWMVLCVFIRYFHLWMYISILFLWCCRITLVSKFAPSFFSYSGVQVSPLFASNLQRRFCRDNENVNEQIQSWQLFRWPL